MSSARVSASSRCCVVSRIAVPSATSYLSTPLVAARPWVQSRRGLIDEEHVRTNDQPHRCIVPASHASGESPDSSGCRFGKAELVDELLGTARRCRTVQAATRREEDEVLDRCELVVDGSRLSHQSDALADLLRLGAHVIPGVSSGALSNRRSVDNPRTAVVLPAPLGPSSASTRPSSSSRVSSCSPTSSSPRPKVFPTSVVRA